MGRPAARVICNPSSGGGAYDPDVLRAEFDGYELDWVETEGPGDASEAAREWPEGLLIVAGGDGTINDAVNGLGKAGFPEGVTLGILPAGTGNDLAATLCIPDDPDEAEDVIRQGRGRTLGVARVRSGGAGGRGVTSVRPGRPRRGGGRHGAGAGEDARRRAGALRGDRGAVLHKRGDRGARGRDLRRQRGRAQEALGQALVPSGLL